MAQRFEGSFQVQDNEFELDVRALIVRDDGIALELEGWDGDGHFHAEGLAPRRSDGSIAPAAIRYRYLGNCGDYRATLQINATHRGKDQLDVEGQWLQFGESWKLRATLKARAAGPATDSMMR
jgi:hypothetical protein